MNKEEAYNLEKGQEVFVRAIFTNFNEDSEIRCITEDADGTEWSVYSDLKNVFTALPTANENATENKPKHDPCRLFKKGDIVKTVERWGRKVPDAVNVYGYEVPDGPENKEWIVEEAETFGMVEVRCKIKGEFYIHKLPFFHLELVTPVEELKPYSVHEESTHNRWNVIKDKYVHGIHAMFPYKNIGNSDLMSREEAKARADEYSDHLNAEWRKKQNND